MKKNKELNNKNNGKINKKKRMKRLKPNRTKQTPMNINVDTLFMKKRLLEKVSYIYNETINNDDILKHIYMFQLFCGTECEKNYYTTRHPNCMTVDKRSQLRISLYKWILLNIDCALLNIT